VVFDLGHHHDDLAVANSRSPPAGRAARLSGEVSISPSHPWATHT
jgi:hypothetical protein